MVKREFKLRCDNCGYIKKEMIYKEEDLYFDKERLKCDICNIRKL